jgi:flagellar motor protein MotB
MGVSGWPTHQLEVYAIKHNLKKPVYTINRGYPLICPSSSPDEKVILVITVTVTDQSERLRVTAASSSHCQGQNTRAMFNSAASEVMHKLVTLINEVQKRRRIAQWDEVLGDTI